jgi:hypothetical protein
MEDMGDTPPDSWSESPGSEEDHWGEGNEEDVTLVEGELCDDGMEVD